MDDCPGFFHGRIPFPLPVPCDAIHLVLGALAGTQPAVRWPATLAFVTYQTVEELPEGHVRAFAKDVTVFLVGLLLGSGLRAAAAAH